MSSCSTKAAGDGSSILRGEQEQDFTDDEARRFTRSQLLRMTRAITGLVIGKVSAIRPRRHVRLSYGDERRMFTDGRLRVVRRGR